jgi:molybdopterin converting factor small subunit
MNTVTVILYANFREVTGTGRIELEMPLDATVGDVKQELLKMHPRLRTHFAKMTTVVNKHNVSLDSDPLPQNAEVILMPPLAGG